MLRGPECEHLFFGPVDVVDGHVDVQLLRVFGARPARRPVVVDPLEGKGDLLPSRSLTQLGSF